MPKNIRWIIAVIFSALSFSVEAYLAYAFSVSQIGVWTLLGGHLCVMVMLGIWLLTELKVDASIRIPLVVILITSVSGVFGAFGMMILVLLYPIFLRSAHVFLEWFSALFPEENKIYGEQVYERVIYGIDDFSSKANLVPFRDIIFLGTENQKRHVLGAISRNFHRSFVSTLKHAIYDKSNGVRVLSANVLAKYDQRYSHQLMILESQYKERPEDKILLELAETCYRYAESGLLDDLRQKEIRQKAILYYEQYLQERPEADRGLLYILGGLYFKSQRLHDAYEKLKPCEEEKTIPAKVLQWYMGCLFELGHYQKLRTIIAKHLPDWQMQDDKKMEAFLPTLALWTHDKASDATPQA